MHAYLFQSGRGIFLSATDEEALAAAFELAKLEGIIPALESAHALSALKQIKFDVSDTTNEALVTATNSKGTNILCFERFLFKDKINPDDFPDKTLVRCGGTLEKIETNPNKSMIWILRLTIKDAFARKAG